MLISVILSTLVLGLILCNIAVKWYLYYLKVRNLPSPPASLIFGHLHYFFRGHENILEVANKLRKNFDKLVSFWFGPLHFVFIFDPKYVEAICKTSNLTTTGTGYNLIIDIVGINILTTEGKYFDEKKKIFMKTLCTNNVLKMIDKFNENAEIVVNNLRLSLEDNRYNTVKMDHYVRDYICRGLFKNILGMPNNFNKDFMDKVIRLSKGTVNVLTERITKPYLYYSVVFQFSKLNSFVVKQRMEFTELCINWIGKVRANINKDTDSKLPTVITSFLTSRDHLGKEYSEIQISKEIVALITASLETSAYSIEKFFLLLGKHRSVQNKVYEEIYHVIGDSQRPITHEDVTMMTYLYQVLQETWRLFPPVALVGRLTQEDIYLDKHFLPKGTDVAIPIKLINLNEKVFPNPEEFNPENFDLDKVRERHKLSFMPFFTGVRKCVGTQYAIESIMIFLIIFLRNFEISYDGEVELERRPTMLLESNENYGISICRRDCPLKQ